MEAFKRYLGLDYIKLSVCTHYQWDFFTTEKPFENWVFLYMGILMVTQEKVKNIYTPLAELAGEVSGALANPEAFQSYAKNKRAQEAVEKGEALHEVGEQGGMAVANTTFKDGKIVNSATGEELMTTEMLEELINKGFAGT